MGAKTTWILAPFLLMASGAQAVNLDPLVRVEGNSGSFRIVNSVRTVDGEVIPNQEWFSYIRPSVSGHFEGYSDISVYDRDGHYAENLTDIVSYPGVNEFGSVVSLYFYLYDNSYSGSFYFGNDVGAVYRTFSNISLTDIIVNFTIGVEAELSWEIDYPGFRGSLGAYVDTYGGGSAQGCGEGASASIGRELFDGSSGSESVSHSKNLEVQFAPGDFCEFEQYGGESMSAEWSPVDAPVPVPLPSPLLLLASGLGLSLAGSARLRRREV
jgi:hypothetical protein